MSEAAFGSIDLFENPSAAGQYFYVPRQADVQRTPDGQPAFSLISTGNGGYLMLTAEWRADDAGLACLRHELARRDATRDPLAVRLAFAPVSIKSCKVLLRTNADVIELLGASMTSGVPPFPAVFAISLNQEQFDRASEAVRGKPGILEVEYEATLDKPVAIRGKLAPATAKLAEFLAPFRAAPAPELRQALEAAIREGLVNLLVEPPDDAHGGLVCSLYERVLDRAISLLPAWLERAGTGAAAFEVCVALVRDVRVPIRARADLALLGSTQAVRSFDPIGGKDAAD